MRASLILLLCIAVVTAHSVERAKWGISSGAGILYDCRTQAGCRGNELDVYDFTSYANGTNVASRCEADFGSAEIKVEMMREGAIFLPRMTGHARSVGPNFHWNRSGGYAVEGYRYVGSTNRTLRFAVSLEGRSSGTLSYEGLIADVYFFKSEGFTLYFDLPTIIYETEAKTITNATLSIRSTNSNERLTRTLEVPVEPNETVYLFSGLRVEIFSLNGFTETGEGLRIVCETPENLVSTSFDVNRPLDIKASEDSLTLTIPSSRRQAELQQLNQLGEQWLSFEGAMETNEFGVQVTLPPSAGSQFWRVKWN